MSAIFAVLGVILFIAGISVCVVVSVINSERPQLLVVGMLGIMAAASGGAILVAVEINRWVAA